MNKLLERNLPKWPALTVVGNPITHGQACEVLIRTSSFHFSGNDRNFKRSLYDVLGIPPDDFGATDDNWRAHLDGVRSAMEKYRCLNLEYLQNHRILSAYIGGHHGWCNWNGRIHCDSYNIGKWPSCERVFQEWKLIAEAFPFLQLKSQLWSGEQCEEGHEPIIQFNVANGNVEVREPEELIAPVYNNDIEAESFLSFGRERGCTIEEFKRALKICRMSNNI